jgi:hypothetical protein
VHDLAKAPETPGQRQRVVIPKPARRIPNPTTRFQLPIFGIGYVVWLM